MDYGIRALDGLLGLPVLRPVTQTILTVGSGVYVPPAGCTAILVEALAGGGSGGGTSGGVGQAAAASGGGSGSYGARLITEILSSFEYTAGAGGAAPAAGANNGNGGNASTFGGTLIVTNAGSGGAAMGTGVALSVSEHTPGGGAGTGGDINQAGSPGMGGIRLSSTVVNSGNGASSRFGGGGRGRVDVGTAGAAGAYGAGGGGGCSVGNNNSAGAAGGDGVIVITEYYG